MKGKQNIHVTNGKKIVKRKKKRGRRNSAKHVLKKVIFSGFNPNGAKSKWTTIKKFIRDTMSSVITMQETKWTQVGQINLDGYYTYEHVRSSKEGGGISISALKQLHPAFVSNGGEEAEAITIDIHVQNMEITITSAYGPHESDTSEKKNAFWTYLSDEACRAKTSGNG